MESYKILSIIIVSAPKIPLNEQCDQRDVCRDDFADCHPFQSKCLCKEGHFERSRQCGTVILILITFEST